jgi:hypothetical protein
MQIPGRVMVLLAMVVVADCFSFVVAVTMATTCTSLMMVPTGVLEFRTQCSLPPTIEAHQEGWRSLELA